MSQGSGYFNQRIAPIPKKQVWKYDGWKKGENSFSQDNEIRNDEFYEGENLEIVGKASIQLPRRGRSLFATLPQTAFNGWGVYKDPITGVNVLLAQSGGHLYKVTSAAVISEIDATKTWDTTARMRGVLLRGFFYFGNGVDYMAKTDGTTVTRWSAVTLCTMVSVTLTGSGATDLFTYGVTAVTDVGETEISTQIDAWGPAALSTTNKFVLLWTRKTDVSIRGYNIYRSINGGTLRLLSYLDQQATGTNMTYTDDGVDTASLIYEAPTFNTTGGVKGNIFDKYANTIFVTGNLQEPDTVFYGGTGSMWESFNPSDNGGWIKPGRGDGEKCTAMIGFEDFLVIFKENSVWKFIFGSDGGPQLISVIPQYGTSSPDTVRRMEKDVVFMGTDGRYRIFGYEPSQLDVLRVSDFSNRIQPRLDIIDFSLIGSLFGIFYDQKYILCDKTSAFPYDRRYIGFLGKWTNHNLSSFIVWDKATGRDKLFAIQTGTGKIYQMLVDNLYTDDGVDIPAFLRVKRIDGGEDTVLKYYYHSKIKFRNGLGVVTLYTYKDGQVLVSQSNIEFEGGGGIDEWEWDEPMFDEGVIPSTAFNTLSIVKKWLEFEAYSIYHQVSIVGNATNHCIVQTMNGEFEVEDTDYERDEKII